MVGRMLGAKGPFLLFIFSYDIFYGVCGHDLDENLFLYVLQKALCSVQASLGDGASTKESMLRDFFE